MVNSLIKLIVILLNFGLWSGVVKATDVDLVDLTVLEASFKVVHGQQRLSFTIEQSGEQLRQLSLPISIYDVNGKHKQLVELNQAQQKFELGLDNPPHKVVLDEDQELARKLLIVEGSPVLANILAETELLLVVAEQDKPIYQPVIEQLGDKNLIYTDVDTLTFAQLHQHTTLIIGKNNPSLSIMAHTANLANFPVTLQVFNNPYNREKYILYLHSDSQEEINRLDAKISNYAEYSSLGFEQGKNIHKSIAASTNGITIYKSEPSYAIPTKQMSTLATILPELATKQLIYVGEQHDKYAHHLNQLTIIKYLHAQGHELAIGMEMFQRKHQLILDQYIAGMLSERAFLRESEYFKTWFYDYNLYKPILDYARKHNIPVIALNINDDVVREMSEMADSGLHALGEGWFADLPNNLDFTNSNYQNDLYGIFSYHEEISDNSSFSYFVQMQTLWDETMAESIIAFLQANPESKMVVLAGNWHVRHYGIPQRVFARQPIDYINIIQDDDLGANFADYGLLTKEITGQAAYKLGIRLEEQAVQQVRVVQVEENSLAQRAGIQVDDLILQFADIEIQTIVDLRYAMFHIETGQSVDLIVQRGTENMQLSIKFD